MQNPSALGSAITQNTPASSVNPNLTTSNDPDTFMAEKSNYPVPQDVQDSGQGNIIRNYMGLLKQFNAGEFQRINTDINSNGGMGLDDLKNAYKVAQYYDKNLRLVFDPNTKAFEVHSSKNGSDNVVDSEKDFTDQLNQGLSNWKGSPDDLKRWLKDLVTPSKGKQDLKQWLNLNPPGEGVTSGNGSVADQLRQQLDAEKVQKERTDLQGQIADKNKIYVTPDDLKEADQNNRDKIMFNEDLKDRAASRKAMMFLAQSGAADKAKEFSSSLASLLSGKKEKK